MPSVDYERIGVGYSEVRRADPRIAARIEVALWGEVKVLQVPVPHACRDGFYQAYWRRPRGYLDRRVRDGISVFHRLAADEVAAAMERLRHDLDGRAWAARHHDLRQQTELDVGLRLAVVELDAGRSR